MNTRAFLAEWILLKIRQGLPELLAHPPRRGCIRVEAVNGRPWRRP